MASAAPSSALLRCLFLCLGLAAAAQGSHRHHHGSKSVKGCARCPPEWGVAKLCDAVKVEAETVCRPCPPGTWTPSHPHLMACRPCSRCGVGLYIHRFCHPTADTECGWCSNPLHDRFTADYLRKCAPRPVPGTQDDAINKLWEERTKAEHPEDRIHPLPSLTHRLWQLKDLRDSAHSPEVVLKPSYHQYQLEDAPESSEDGMSGRTKAWVMLSIAGLLLLLVGLISAAVCQHRFGRRPHRLYVALTDADQRIISECAANLDEKDTARHHRFQGQENPLAALLPSLEELPAEEHVDYARTHHRQS